MFGRLGDLLAIIDFHSETLKAWYGRASFERSTRKTLQGCTCKSTTTGGSVTPLVVLRLTRTERTRPPGR